MQINARWAEGGHRDFYVCFNHIKILFVHLDLETLTKTFMLGLEWIEIRMFFYSSCKILFKV